MGTCSTGAGAGGTCSTGAGAGGTCSTGAGAGGTCSTGAGAGRDLLDGSRSWRGRLGRGGCGRRRRLDGGAVRGCRLVNDHGPGLGRRHLREQERQRDERRERDGGSTQKMSAEPTRSTAAAAFDRSAHYRERVYCPGRETRNAPTIWSRGCPIRRGADEIQAHHRERVYCPGRETRNAPTIWSRGLPHPSRRRRDPGSWIVRHGDEPRTHRTSHRRPGGAGTSSKPRLLGRRYPTRERHLDGIALSDLPRTALRRL